MAREPRSHVKKRRHGCLGGCLVRILLLLGVLAMLFVGACVLGFVQIDPDTGAPQLDLGAADLGSVALPDLGGMIPAWAYGVEKTGMTVKTLRTAQGEAVLVCCDGYTMLVGAGSSGLLAAGQLLLCGARSLDAAVALSSEEGQTGGMSMAMRMTKPDYLLATRTQTSTKGYNAMLETAQAQGTQVIVPDMGLSFSLGRATVSVVGPRYLHHPDERDDGLSLRVDYGNTSVLIMGTVTQAAETELLGSGAPLDADVLICGCGGSEEATGTRFAETVSPRYAVMTGKSPANPVRVRLQRAGAQVYTVKEHGVITVISDGQNIRIEP